jgi:phage antirepressor YoqD-like protein
VTLDLIVREYHGAHIRQRPDGYLSLTDMAQATDRMVNHWRANRSTAAFLHALRGSTGIPVDVLVEVNASGVNDLRGTWAHPQAAHHFALWCSPEFAVRVTAWVEDIRTKGYAVDERRVSALPAVDLDDPGSLRGLVEALVVRRLADGAKIAELTPKAEALDRLSSAHGDLCLQDAGRALGRQPNVLVRMMIEDGVLFRGAHGKPEPMAAYRESGYFRLRVIEQDGLAFVQTLVTPRGLVWLAARYPVSDAVSGQLSLLPGRAVQVQP